MDSSFTVGLMRKALIVRGGAEFHQPVETTDSFLPFLEKEGFDVTIADSLDVYEDQEQLQGTHLILQCWTRGELTRRQFEGLDAAVRSGVGFAGWHGGIVAAFTEREYQWMTGGWFVCHPGSFVPHRLTVVKDHPIVAGLSTVELDTERYWVLTDQLNDVLATITFPVEDGAPWREPVTHPAVWTRQWGQGRIFVSTVGHHLPDLDVPEIRLLTERGMLWAARPDTSTLPLPSPSLPSFARKPTLAALAVPVPRRGVAARWPRLACPPPSWCRQVRGIRRLWLRGGGPASAKAA